MLIEDIQVESSTEQLNIEFLKKDKAVVLGSISLYIVFKTMGLKEITPMVR